MGRSEWGVLVRSKADVRRVLQAAREHNACPDPDDRGEDLGCYCLLRFHGLPFLCLGNGGGRSYTNRFLWAHLPDVPIFWALSKPPGWHECQDYLWKSDDDGLDAVPVDALPLPDDTPPGPLPSVPALGNWLEPAEPASQLGGPMKHLDVVGFSCERDPQTGQMVQRNILRGDS